MALLVALEVCRSILTYSDVLMYAQIIQIFWCYMIFRVAARVVMGQGADDSRSDDEG